MKLDRLRVTGNDRHLEDIIITIIIITLAFQAYHGSTCVRGQPDKTP